MEIRKQETFTISSSHLQSEDAVGDRRDRLQRIPKLAARLVGAAVVFGIACSLFVPMLPPLGFLDVRAFLFVAVLLAAGIWDLRTGRVPAEITLPLMAAAILRGLLLQDLTFLLAWGMLIAIYLLHILGGGDSKLLMGLFGLFPSVTFYYAFAVFWVVTHYPLLLYWRLRTSSGRARLKHFGLWMLLQSLHFLAGQVTRERVRGLLTELSETWPSDDDLSCKGLRMAITISSGGILYLFLMTPAGLNWQFPF